MESKQKPKCLFICTISPLNDRIKTGGVNLTKANYLALSDFADIVIMNSLAGPANLFSKIVRLIQAAGGDLAGNSPFFRQKIKKLLRKEHFDLVFIDHSQLGNLAPMIKSVSPRTRLLGAFQNIESQYIAHSLRLPALAKSLLQWAASINEQTLVEHADNLICLTQEDSDVLRTQYGRPANVVIPITMPEPPLRGPAHATPSGQPYLLFCGSYFEPNIQGIQWFVENVLPHTAHPLLIIGYQMERLRAMIEHPQIQIIGTVPDVAPYYRGAAAVINPVFKGAGMNSKSVEALAYGKSLFATNFALRGLPSPIPPPVAPCNTAEEFVRSLALPNETAAPLEASTTYFRTHFTFAQRRQKFLLLIKSD